MSWVLISVFVFVYFSIAGMFRYQLVNKTIRTPRQLPEISMERKNNLAIGISLMWPVVVALAIVSGFVYFFMVRVEIPKGASNDGIDRTR